MIQNLLFADQLPPGISVLRGRLDAAAQKRWLDMIEEIKAESPLAVPRTKFATDFRVSITSAGDYGWWSDETGYRYRKDHPVTKRPWAKMPAEFYETARSSASVGGWEAPYAPDTCLINFYPPATGRLGLHRDDTEKDLISPIVTVSLGDICLFLVGGERREDPTMEIILDSGDVMVMHGPGRLLFHSVKEIVPASSALIGGGGRYSLTFRRNKIR